MNFPKNSAWDEQPEIRRGAPLFPHPLVPVRTPEENQRIANEVRDQIGKYQRVHEDTLVEWANEIEDLAEQISHHPSILLEVSALEDIAEKIRSHLRG